jgi:hypothetical protein
VPEQVLIHADATTIDLSALGHTVVICDPPYAARVHAGMTSCAAHGTRKGVRQRAAGFQRLSEDLRLTIAEACGLAARWSVVYSDLEGVGAWAACLDRHIRTVVCVPDESDEPILGRVIPWVRWSMPQLSGDRPTSGAEAVVLAHGPGRKHWGGPGNLVALCHSAERGEDKHPTAKPLDQMLDLVAWFSDPGDLVLDLTAGRATTGVACALLNRDFIGLEWNPDDDSEFRKGSERLENARRGRLSKRDQDRFDRWYASIGGDWATQDLQRPFRKGTPS